MRSDKEQFENVCAKLEAHESAGKARKKLLIVLTASVLVLAMLLTSVLVLHVKKPPKEAEERKPGTLIVDKSEEHYILSDGSTGSKIDYSDRYPPMEFDEPGDGLGDREYSYDVGFDYEKSALSPVASESEYGLFDGYSGDTDIIPVIPGEGLPGFPREDGQSDYRAGQLTGAELRDREYYENFITDAKKLSESSSISSFDVFPFDRVKVTVKNGETALCGVKVQLIGENGVLYSAVTDNTGTAFVFFDLHLQSADKPQKVVCTFGGKTAEASVLDGDKVLSEVALSLDAQNNAKKLDLMFMIDTTGSMSDELEYLKSEISDIIARVYDDGQLPVRTSVNFYRDRGDEYVVHATPFTADVSEVLSYIGKEYATGGGDTPEAVHTALDNAVNGHEWDPDAEKMLFFVLDAPPHSESAVYESLNASIVAAAEKGIRIVPIVSSGADGLVEYLMRSYAVLTGGTYTFLTDHSGIGNPHKTPDTEFQYTIEMLNDMIVRIVREYCA